MGFMERLRKEWLCLRGALRALRMTTPIAKNPERVFPLVLEDLARQHGDRIALLSDTETLTFRQLDERANRYARWAQTHGIGKGDVVALFMPNRPEYLAIWMGITRAGGVVALLNTNLTGPSLSHCINIVAPKAVIMSADLSRAFDSARPSIADQPAIWRHGGGISADARIDTFIADLDGSPLRPDERVPLTIEDKALYIYTSGTTGMPKAANINHYRLMAISHGFSGAMDTRPSDRMYACLPMYHTVGGIIAPCATLVGGGSTFIRDKFSATSFWDDIVRNECTLFQYIGELCRYLINSPETEAEKRHKVRLCCGNGLRPDVWPIFKARFKVPTILEFYAATEGNVALFNFDGTEGAVGRIPRWAERRFIVKVVKYDHDMEAPMRGPDGFCIECAPGEVGEPIGKILNDPSKPANRFEGYADNASTEKKILRDAFERGDAWFRTGDLMKKDARGYFYFVDRIGDTFRWKGENVATSEVSEAITVFPGVKDANVYGVSIEGRDGRAGMAALVVADGFDFAAFREHLEVQLPEYARPLFVRIHAEASVTTTFKPKKIDLVAEGFDPSKISDELWFNNPETGRFERIDDDLYQRIQSGGVRL